MSETHFILIVSAAVLAMLFAGYFLYYRRVYARWAVIAGFFGGTAAALSLLLSVFEHRWSGSMSARELISMAYFRSYLSGLASGILFTIGVVFFCNRILFLRDRGGQKE